MHPPPGPATIVFDLDGTLVDTAPDIAAALNGALARYGTQAFTAMDIARMIGDGLPALFGRALDAASLDLSPAEREAACADFIARYTAEPAALSRPYSGMPSLLDALAARDIALAVCTNKREEIAVDILERLGLAPRFAAIVGAVANRPRKPDPAPLLHALSATGAKPDQALMIGDSAADSGAARAAGVKVVLLGHGYSTRPIEALGADLCLPDTVALARLLLLLP